MQLMLLLLEIHYLVAVLNQAVVWVTAGGDKDMNRETGLRPIPPGGSRMGNML